MRKKLCCLILGIIMLFNIAACSDSKDDGKKVPTFVESDIGKVLGINPINQIKMNSKDQLVVYSASKDIKKYITFDQSGKKLNEISCDIKGDGSQFDLDSEDNIIILSQNAVTDNKTNKIKEYSRHLYKYNSKGEKLKDIDLGKAIAQNGEDIYVCGIAVDSKGYIYLTKNNSNFEVLDSNGKSIKNDYVGKYNYIDIGDKDNIIAGTLGIDGGKPYIEKVNAKKWESLWKKELNAGDYIKSIYYNKSDKYIYALTDKGIDRYDSKGNYLVRVLDFGKENLLKSGRYFVNLAVDDKVGIYLLYSDFDGSSAQFALKKFEVDKDGAQKNKSQASSEKKVLKLSAEFADKWLQTSVSTFQSQHPDIEIKVKDFKVAYTSTSSSDGQTGEVSEDQFEEVPKRQEEFRNVLNTEIMAGTAPDIIYLPNSDLPLRKYVDKNAFCNLSEMMDKDKSFNLNELNTNILNAIKYKGNIYTIPISFAIPVIEANKNIIKKESLKIDDTTWTWDDLLDISRKVSRDTNNDGESEQYAFSGELNGSFVNMFSQNYDRFIDMDKKKADFTGDEFVNMLKLGRAFSDKKITYVPKDYNKYFEMTSRGVVAFTDSAVYGYLDLKTARDYLFKGEVALLRYPSFSKQGNTGGVFYPRNILAISSKSKYKEEAWEFIKYLLSKDEQSSPDLFELPINNKALSEKAQYWMDMNIGVTKEDIDEINKFVAEAKVYHYIDSEILNMVSEEVKKIFSGEKTQEEIVKTLQNKVNIYLGE